MEYCISNKPFSGCQMVEGIFIKGEYKKIGDLIAVCEGYLLDERYDDFQNYIEEGIEQNHSDGIYGIVIYNTKTGEILVKGDKWGLYSLYIYENGGVWAISNNVWTLVELFRDEVTIDQDSLISQLVYITDVVPGRTLFSPIKRLVYGEKGRINKDGKLMFERYWDFNYLPNQNLTEEQVFEQLDESLTKMFQLIKKRNPNLVMGIGCSGGLDSRIIMHYVNKVGLDHTSYVFCQKQRIPGLNTATYITSQGVADIFGDTVNVISTIVDGVLEDSMLLDVRNQPFCTSQIYKNLYPSLPMFDFMMTGQPGGAMKTPDLILTDQEDKIAAYTTDHLGNQMSAFSKFTYFLRKLRYSFPLNYDSTKETGITGLNKSLINSIIPNNLVEKSKRELFSTIEKVKGKCGYETWQRLQAIIVNSMQYGGGYESLSNLKKSYYLYLPGAESSIEKYIPTKDFLKRFINYVNSTLAAVPDQKLNRITDNKFKNQLRQLEYIFRGQGINIEKNIDSKEYKTYARKIMTRENPIFYKYISKKQVLTSGILNTVFSSTLVKKKLICDIFYYQEFNVLKRHTDWMKV